MTGGDHTNTVDAAKAFAFEKQKLQELMELRQKKLGWEHEQRKNRVGIRRKKFEAALRQYREQDYPDSESEKIDRLIDIRREMHDLRDEIAEREQTLNRLRDEFLDLFYSTETYGTDTDEKGEGENA